MSSYMHLCFVFIPKCKSLVNVSICLDDRYIFNFDYKNNALTYQENKNHVNHLWGKSIYSLTAIVGDNGAGKTTAIRYIMERVVSGFRKEGDYGVYVVEENGKLKVFTTRNITVNGKRKYEIGSFSIETFFYSAHLTIPFTLNGITNRDWGGMYNGSDYFRLFKDFQDYCNVDTTYMQCTFRQHIIGYNYQNWYRISLLLAEQYDYMEGCGLKPPRFIHITPNISGDTSSREKSKGVEGVNIPKFGLPPNTKLTEEKKIISMFVYSILLNIATNDAMMNVNVLKILKEWVGILEKNVIDDDNFYELFEQLLGKYFLKDIVVYISTLLQKLESLCDFSKDYKNFFVDLNDKEKRLEFIKLLDYTKKHSIFLTARFFDMFYAHESNPNNLALLSSGEQEMLNLFSRIYDAVYPHKMHSAENIKSKQLLILDEAEIGYHPKWQRKYVNNLVKFLNFLTKEEDFFQVILTSHSPIILSDIPKSCTNYLKMDNEKVEDIPEETFGANIFDLYRNSFFMNDGLIGEFALNKIQKVLKAISPKENNKKVCKSSDDDMKEAEKIISLIGDDRIRDYLKEKFCKDNPQYAIYCYKRKIEELQDKIKNEQDRIS